MEVVLPKPDARGLFPALPLSPDPLSEQALHELENVFSAMPPSVARALGCELCPARALHPTGPEATTRRLPNGKVELRLACPGAQKYIASVQQRAEIAQSHLACSEQRTLYVRTEQVSQAVPLESLTWSISQTQSRL